VFEVEDLVLKIIDFTEIDFACLLRCVNSCFDRTLQKYYKGVIRSPINLYEFCRSVSLLTWAINAGGCPLEICRQHCIMHAASHGSLDVLKWCSAQNPPYEWSSACCMVAAAVGQIPVLDWLVVEKPEWWGAQHLGYQLVHAGAIRTSQLRVLLWLKCRKGLFQSEEDYEEGIREMLVQLSELWVGTGDRRLVNQITASFEERDHLSGDPLLLTLGLQAIQETIEIDDFLMTKGDVKAIIALTSGIISAADCSDELIDHATETISSLIRHRSKLIAKMHLIKPMLQESVDMLAKSDQMPWPDMTGVESNMDRRVLFAFARLDKLALSMVPQSLDGPARALFAECLRSSDWRQRKGGCCLLAAMAEGCCDVFAVELLSVVSQLCHAARDKVLPVRVYAMSALQQLCEFCQPTIGHHHDAIYKVVFEILSRDDVSIVEQQGCCYVLEHLSKGLEPVTITPYLPQIVHFFHVLITSPTLGLRSAMVSALHDIAVAARQAFLPHVQVNPPCNLYTSTDVKWFHLLQYCLFTRLMSIVWFYYRLLV
jgi:hypothetical protein